LLQYLRLHPDQRLVEGDGRAEFPDKLRQAHGVGERLLEVLEAWSTAQELGRLLVAPRPVRVKAQGNGVT
jgi:hypothetical protein